MHGKICHFPSLLHHKNVPGIVCSRCMLSTNYWGKKNKNLKQQQKSNKNPEALHHIIFVWHQWSYSRPFCENQEMCFIKSSCFLYSWDHQQFQLLHWHIQQDPNRKANSAFKFSLCIDSPNKWGESVVFKRLAQCLLQLPLPSKWISLTALLVRMCAGLTEPGRTALQIFFFWVSTTWNT